MKRKHQVIKRSQGKKIRGIKKKVKNLLESIYKNTSNYPNSDIYKTGYVNYTLPCYQGFIDCTDQMTNVRQQTCQALIDSTQILIQQKPLHLKDTKVVLTLCLPNIWYSQITVFFDLQYYQAFFKRNSLYQTWLPVCLYGSSTSTYTLQVPDPLDSCLIKETMKEDGDSYTSEIFIVGELPF